MNFTEDTLIQLPTNPGEPYVFSCAGYFDAGYLEVRYNDGENSIPLPNGGFYSGGTFTFIAPTRLVDIELIDTGSPDITASLLPVTSDNYSTIVSGIVDGKANDNAVVHLTGAEIVDGEKTLTSRLQLTGQPGSPAANDAMTRELSDARYARARVSVLASDQTVTSSTTLTDSALSLPIDTSGIWRFSACLRYEASNYSTDGGFQGSLKASGYPALTTLTGRQSIFYEAGTIYGFFGCRSGLRSRFEHSIDATGFNAAMVVEMNGVFNFSNTGTIIAQFAQHSSTSTGTILKAGSWISVEKIP